MRKSLIKIFKTKKKFRKKYWTLKCWKHCLMLRLKTESNCAWKNKAKRTENIWSSAKILPANELTILLTKIILLFVCGIINRSIAFEGKCILTTNCNRKWISLPRMEYSILEQFPNGKNWHLVNYTNAHQHIRIRKKIVCAACGKMRFQSADKWPYECQLWR